MREEQRELAQVNRDIIFLFLTVISAFISFYIIIEKKKSILNIGEIQKEKINKIYQNNRMLGVIIWLYFLFNSYYSLKNEKNPENLKEDYVFLLAAVLGTLSALCYLPYGNSNVIIKK